MSTDDTDTALVHEVARRMRLRPDAVFDVESPETLVPLLPVQELLFAIQEMGVVDSADLLALTTPTQVQSMLDLSLWRRDRIEPEELVDWITVLLELDEVDFAHKMRALDAELLGQMLKELVEVYDPQLQPVPDLEVAPYTTPDTFFLLSPRQPPVDPDTGEPPDDWDPSADPRFPLAVRLVDRLYRTDPERARDLIMETASSTASELEELSYRWRSGRLADLGYEPHAEAIEILQFLDPAQLEGRLPEPDPPAPARDPADPVTLGGVLIEPWSPSSEEPYLEACLDTLEPADLDRVTQGYTFLANRLAAATLTTPGNVDQMREVLTRARRGLNLGLEYLTRRKPEATPEVLAKVPVQIVFRIGHSLTLQLQRLVSALGRTGRLSLAGRGATLLDPPWRELATGLGQRFPELTRAFDDPPGQGFRPILSLADLLHATQLVEDLGALWPLCFVSLRFDPAWLTEEKLAGCEPSEPGAVRLGDLFRTAVVRHALEQGLAMEPLEDATVEAAREPVARRVADLEAWVVELEEVVVGKLAETRIEPPKRLRRILRTWIAPLAAAGWPQEVVRRPG